MSMIFILIPIHNDWKYTKECLMTLERQTFKNYKVVIIDSGSTDQSSIFIKRNFPDVSVINGEDSWYWTKSISEGIKYSLKLSGEDDYLLMMNNDCQLDHNYLSEMLIMAQANPNSVIGSSILDVNTKRVVGRGVEYDFVNKKYIDSVSRIDTLPGRGTMFQTSMVKKIGNVAVHLLPHYLADYEYFCRAKSYGYKLLIAKKAKLFSFSKKTGLEKFDRKRIRFSLFDRKSKVNIVDRLLFELLVFRYRVKEFFVSR